MRDTYVQVNTHTNSFLLKNKLEVREREEALGLGTQRGSKKGVSRREEKELLASRSSKNESSPLKVTGGEQSSARTNR